MNESPLKKYFEPSAFKKTIAKNAGIDPIEPTDKEKKMIEARKGLKTGMMEGAAEAASKTIRNQIPNIHKGPRGFEPAFEGADHTQEELDNMTKKQQEDYYN